MALNTDKKNAIIESIANGSKNKDAYDDAGVPARTYYNWMKEETFRKDVLNARSSGQNIRVHEVEDALYKLALSGNPTAQIFFLKNRASAAWSDKHELTGASDKTIINVVTTENKKTAVALDNTLRL